MRFVQIDLSKFAESENCYYYYYLKNTVSGILLHQQLRGEVEGWTIKPSTNLLPLI